MKFITTAILLVGLAYIGSYWLHVKEYHLDMGQALILTAGVLQLIWGDK